MTGGADWQPGEFTVQLGKRGAHPVPVAGSVWGTFGVCLVDGRFEADVTRWFGWRVTHLPTGLNLHLRAADFSSEADARAFAKAIAPLTDWTALTGRQRGMSDLRERCRDLFDAIRRGEEVSA